jgi:putative endonuclease
MNKMLFMKRGKEAETALHSREQEYICFMYNKNFQKEPTEKQKIGQIGEDFACEYLQKQGFKIIDRNYLKKWGEIDIIAQKNNKIHFVEVKTVSRNERTVIYETSDSYRAEDNMHPWKLQRLARAVQSYLLDKNVREDMEWQFDLATVHINANKGLLKVMMLEDIVL